MANGTRLCRVAGSRRRNHYLHGVMHTSNFPPVARKPRAAEFFAGIGLVRLALEGEGWSVIFANDNDDNKGNMYRANWNDDHHLSPKNIRDLNPSDIPTCELFTASFPCNDLSIAGRWEGLNGSKSSTYWQFIELVKAMKRRRPPLILLENVVGFLLRDSGNDLKEALVELSALGYNVDAFILNAICWTPQSRKRLFVVGQRGKPRMAAVPPRVTDVRPAALIDFVNRHPQIQWHLRALPGLPALRLELSNIIDRDYDKWWGDDRVRKFRKQMSPRHCELAEKLQHKKEHVYATAFRRMRGGESMAELRTDGIAGCLRTPRGGSAKQILVRLGKGEFKVRLLSPRECARLQGVPDDYPINVSENQALFGFGDAVCVPAVAWIARNVLTPSLPSERMLSPRARQATTPRIHAMEATP
jgi:DNA (cytosine-5)-methyltransferase 1